jgi:arylsulfatase A-like enzyme
VRRILDGVLTAWALVALELVAVSVTERRELAGIWEIQTGALLVAPLALALAAPLGALGAQLFSWIELARSLRVRAWLGALAGAAGALVGWGVGGGRHLAELSTRAGFALLVGVCSGSAVFWLAPRLASAARRAPRRTAMGLAALILGLELANRWILPRLYPAFHLGLSAAALVFAPMITAVLRGQTNESRRLASAFWLALAFALPVSLVLPSVRRLALLDNFRFVFSEHAPILGRVVELAARLAPPESTSAAGDTCPPGASCLEPPEDGTVAPRTLDLSGRDLLLITIDALRADHLGAYGYERPISPHLDKLAAEGVVFERAYTATPHTSYAVVSLMTGKYMRPLLLQGAGADSDTWASLLRTYGYRTGAFYPPAVFFIDPARFESFQKSSLGFEYVKVEFAEGQLRTQQVNDYVARAPRDAPLFVWVHLFGPHEPYVAHPEHPLGDRDIDRYDAEIAAADATAGAIIRRFRELRPGAAVIATADHGEEFGEHGGRYHGTTVYEEQLRVPLVISVPGRLAPRRVREVVSTIDLLPTVLAGLAIPRPPRMRGRDLGPLLTGKRVEEAGVAHGETDEQALFAEGNLRLICARRIGACKLYDLEHDPRQLTDAGPLRPNELERLRTALRTLGASHGRYESQGLRAEGKGWPDAIVRGLSGDGEVAGEVAALLDDVDPAIRRKAAEVLVELRRPETAPALRLALGRDEDPDVRKLSALALTRLGEGAPLVLELLQEPKYRRLAALALAESGDARGRDGLLEWWRDAKSRDFTRSKQMLEAFATLRSKESVYALTAALDDVRLRPELARALARIGEESARGPLAQALADERSQSARVALSKAIVDLGGRYELVSPLVRFLGVPDPLPDGLAMALGARILQHVGGPGDRELSKLRERSELGVRVRVVVPRGGNGRGVRVLVRAECPEALRSGNLLIGGANHLIRYDREGKLLPERKLPEIDEKRALRFSVPCSDGPVELFATLPDSVPAKAGASVELIAFTSREVKLHALALVPLADELPPPPPKPWAEGSPTDSESSRGLR